MRLICSYEEHHSSLNVFLMEGSVKWGEDPIPVVWHAQWGNADAFLGLASDFRREADGAITCEFEPNDNWSKFGVDLDGMLKRGEFGLTIYGNQLVEHKVDSLRVVDNVFLRGCFFDIGCPWRSI